VSISPERTSALELSRQWQSQRWRGDVEMAIRISMWHSRFRQFQWCRRCEW